MTTLVKFSRWFNHRIMGGRHGHMYCSRMYLEHNVRRIKFLDKVLGVNHCKECFYEDLSLLQQKEARGE